MTKTEKQWEKKISQALTNACENSKDQCPGFEWLTHEVNYRQFPQSMRVLCKFDSSENSRDLESQSYLRSQIIQSLAEIKIPLKPKQVEFAKE